ncbi:hypothetical protein [Streptomyces sp. NPDC056600]|uniref:hypothetical protein n=1 Tax=Streptomyces sp. NPDC056600 TaxID=3345874 RepID=UPI003693C5D7
MRHDPTPQDDLRFGGELSRDITAALEGIPLRTDHLVSGAITRGNHIRRRRRVAAWSTACVAAAALTCASLVLALPGDPDRPATVALPPGPAGPGASAPVGKEPVTGAAAAALLAELLPGRPEVAEFSGTDSVPHHPVVQVRGQVTLAGGGKVTVWLQAGLAGTGEPQDPAASDPARGRGKDSGGRSRQPDPGKATGDELAERQACPDQDDDRCRSSSLSDGSVLLSRENRSGEYAADVLRPDGIRVVVVATGTELAPEQLRSVATSPRWELWVDPSVNKHSNRANVDRPRSAS